MNEDPGDMVVGSGGGDGRGGGRVFSRGKGDHVVVGDVSETRLQDSHRLGVDNIYD